MMSMIVKQASLRKILQLIAADEKRRTAILRRDISDSRRPPDPDREGGGDFYSPFWADAKASVRGDLDLRQAVTERIASNGRRASLYPRLLEGFLRIASEGRRLRNEDYNVAPLSPRGRFTVAGLQGVIKVEDTLQLEIIGVGVRTVYPYFADAPEMQTDVARLGLWAMAEALQRPVTEMRLIDILRAETYSTRNAPQFGDEGELFARRYAEICDQWYRLDAEGRD
jgi:hypothetical protein